MFTDKAQSIVDLAKDYAAAGRSAELNVPHLLKALIAKPDAVVLLSESLGLPADRLEEAAPKLPAPVPCSTKLPLTAGLKAIFVTAKELAEQVPDRNHPGLLDVPHVVCATAMSKEAGAQFGVAPLTKQAALTKLGGWQEQSSKAPGLEELVERVRTLRTDLLARVFGQDHAVHAFVEGLFNAEVVAAADTQRKAPRAVFVFAGPPGVGKTYLAELGASHLSQPYKRFDMTAYSDHQQHLALVGWEKSYRGSHAGLLTEFVEKNPNAVLLFDEIEKAHLNTINLFLQILDAGTLEDKYAERNVSFRDTVIIFTTNAGRKLYDRPNESGVHSANAAFHRKTILDALENEVNPATRQPFFPPAICSRMATGYPVLFNHLRVNELERVVAAELKRVSDLFSRQYFKQVSFDDVLPLTLVLREGARSDARTLRSQAEAFFKGELFKFCQLFKADRLDQVLEKVDRLKFELDGGSEALAPEVRGHFVPVERPRVLLVADPDLSELYREQIPDITWHCAASQETALQLLADEEVDLALVDLWLGGSTEPGGMTMQHFDHVPAAARGLDRGQELLRKTHDRLPDLAVFLLSLRGSEGAPEGAVDEELFRACLEAGGARGVIVSQFVDGLVQGWQQHRDEFRSQVMRCAQRLHREKAAARLSQERKILSFDTAPVLDEPRREVRIRLRNLHFARAIAAADAGEMLEDVERPRTRFDEVIGATTAKEELRFFVDFLKNPKRFAALGLKPPKGVLLHGPPGTGKTMLARAMAGESDVAFLAASASGFVTIWQGSGPQNIRDLFARARRYAPSIVFIDEIDAIGKVRTGGPGNHSEENTLNALLTEMDGFTSPAPDRPVFVLAATNFRIKAEDEDSPERSARTLDPALVRRFSRSILVDLPDTEARKQYFLLRLREARNAEVSASALGLLAEKSAGMSIANLEQVIETAARAAVQKGVPMSGELVLEALDTAREGEAKEWSPEFLESTARHEAGHTIMYWLSGWWTPEVSIIARADHGGGMRRSEEEMKRESATRAEMLARIRTLLGGRAAEVLCYGPDRGLTTGASGDLEQATKIARHMVCAYGMEVEFGLAAMPELLRSPVGLASPLFERVNTAVNGILRGQMDETLKLLATNRKHLDALATALLQKNRLYRKDLEELLPKRNEG